MSIAEAEPRVTAKRPIRWPDVERVLLKEGLTAVDTNYREVDSVRGILEDRDSYFTAYLDHWTHDLELEARPFRRMTTVPYPTGLPVPVSFTAAYDREILTAEVRNKLAQVGSRLIYPNEVVSGEVRRTGQPLLSYMAQYEYPRVYTGFAYQFQQSSPNHSRCIAAVDRGVIDPEALPFHRWQKNEGHYCIVDEEKGFPLIPVDFAKFDQDLAVNFNFGNMSPTRVRQLLKGFPLPLNSRLEFADPGPGEGRYRLFMQIKGQKNEGLYAGHEHFTLFWMHFDIGTDLRRYFPPFYRFYRQFVTE